MKLKRFLACLLILSCMSQTSVFSDGLKNNDIHFDTKRLESDSQKNSGFQTELTKDLFKKEDLKKLDKNRQSKVSLQKKQSKKVEEGFFVKSKIANLEYHTNNNITSNERVLAWSDKEPTNNMNLKILSLTLICIP
ncbi:TPA: type VII secretion protein EssA [Streptococcus agalactiae]|nr:type VII secretion protein EssA [Streptococcus agalactiae]